MHRLVSISNKKILRLIHKVKTTNPSSEQSPIIMKTYVVERDLTTLQEKQARLKDLSTL